MGFFGICSPPGSNHSYHPSKPPKSTSQPEGGLESNCFYAFEPSISCYYHLLNHRHYRHYHCFLCCHQWPLHCYHSITPLIRFPKFFSSKGEFYPHLLAFKI